ncbi:NAD-dependent epimerase/dehydratase [Oleiphilus messinensis]|uniref:NAD-dependent epimerase/dehydratase n=1 Tax=Oleiphilus messinensis TaxID=141451 RepID=A0A1Y0IGR6_9GAMM|nr:NAD-dependent epimerase/dehydratase family protein [Oleiphilus messinensis]ARU59026.1 NAD-dependent epimerase/dehydratase [Oleiphilus messinensis]
MQTILGANGQIGQELAINLNRTFTTELRLVSRRPQKIHATDETLSADLLDPQQTLRAVEGSEIVYLTAGLPMNTQLWVEQWPVIMRNVIAACETLKTKLVYFDNTYMYPQTSASQTEDIPFQPNGAKGKVRAEIVTALQQAMDRGKVEAVICRAPEFYGPGKTQSITNTTVIDNLRAGKKAKVFLRDDTLRSLIYTPDASRAMALLGNTPSAYNQTWHLPCDDNRLTYRQFIELAAQCFQVDPKYTVIKRWQLQLAGLFNKTARDAAELLPRYEVDNIFISDKFKSHFPDFGVTSFRDGLMTINSEPFIK